MHHLIAWVKAGTSREGKPLWIIMMQLAKDDWVVLAGSYANKPLHLTLDR